MFARLKRWARLIRTDLLTLWFCRSHPDTPTGAKVAAALVVAYVMSPIDLIPDFIPILGQLDELVLVPLGIHLVMRLIPQHVIALSRRKADLWVADKKRMLRNYVAAALIVLVWIALAYWGWILFAEWKKP